MFNKVFRTKNSVQNKSSFGVLAHHPNNIPTKSPLRKGETLKIYFDDRSNGFSLDLTQIWKQFNLDLTITIK